MKMVNSKGKSMIRQLLSALQRRAEPVPCFAEMVITELDAITGKAFPDHAWKAYGRFDEEAETNFRLVAKSDVDGNGCYSPSSEVPARAFEPVLCAFQEAGIGGTPDESVTAMYITSHSVTNTGNLRPKIMNADPDHLRRVAPLIQAFLDRCPVYRMPAPVSAPPVPHA